MKAPLLACIVTILLSTTTLAQSKPDTQGKIVETYGKLPLSFEANQGQADGKVKFLSRGSGYTLFLTGDEAVFSLRGSKTPNDSAATRRKNKAHGASRGCEAINDQAPAGRKKGCDTDPAAPNTVLRMKLLHANPAANVTGADELPGKSNYFIGSDPQKWRTNVATYAKVKYEKVYPGIDLVYYGNQRQLEYDFVVVPGADPHRIQFDVRGAKHISRDNGDLVLQTAVGEVRWLKPVVYQEKDGVRQQIDGHYTIHRGRVGFEVGSYDLKRSLIIDPALAHSTYFGGSGDDGAYGIAVDSSGNVYITGSTTSADFPTKDPIQPTYAGGDHDAFVTEINHSGRALVYSTYLGGSGDDYGYAIALDASGNAYVTGYTTSTNFPTADPLQPALHGAQDGFVAKLNSSGSVLVYSTYLGGDGADAGTGIALDTSGDAFVTGGTLSPDFPVTPDAFQPTCGGGCGNGNVFVAQFNPMGSALVYSTFLGGSGANAGGDEGTAIAVDPSGNAFVIGITYSSDFPITPGAFQTTVGNGSAFVAQFNATGSALVYSTFLGGSGQGGVAEGDFGSAIAVANGNAYVTGFTESTNFPTTPGAFETTCGSPGCTGSAFVTQFNSTGSGLTYSTYLGGSGGSGGAGITVDGSGNAYVTGTASTGFPVTLGAFQTTCEGCTAGLGNAFVTELNPTGSALVYSTYLGGGGSAGTNGSAIAVDDSGSVYVAGRTSSEVFPVTPGAFQSSLNGPTDAFFSEFIPGPQFWPLLLNFGDQGIGTTSKPQVVTLTNEDITTPLSITSIMITGANQGDFVQTNNCPVGGSLLPGSNCTVNVTFTPTAIGARSAAVSFTDSGPNSPQSVGLFGIGTPPAVTLSPASLNFGNQTVGIASSTQTSTLTNTGNGALNISSITLIGANYKDFPETNNCPSSLAPNSSCEITVSFKPLGTGSESASVNITDNAPGSPQSLPLAGVGVLPAVTFAPTSLTFATQVVFTTSPAQKVTLTNSGLGVLKITAAGLSGQFGETTNCTPTIAPGASCTINVAFKPTTKGTLNGDISITDNAPGSPQKLPLTGTGTYLQISPATVNFGNQPVNTTSLPKYITLTNKGSGPVNFTGTGITITGTNAGDFAEQNNCGTSIARGASCFIKATFTPSALGKRTATVSISDDGGGSPQTVPLTGTGTP